MNYRGKKILMTGGTGFLGKAIGDALKAAGADVFDFNGDVRDRHKLVDSIDHTLDYVFHFADPSSQVLFTRQPRYAAETTISSFLHISKLCQQNGVRLIYPSTGLLSQGKANQYARCKAVCEDIHIGSNLDALGIRIFATYGPGEGHKADYASVPYLLARDMVNGESPVVFGDGSQTRDFLYINDVVHAVITLAEDYHATPIVDVGSGKGISFNDIVKQINELLFAGNTGEYIEPTYTGVPDNYVSETLATKDSHEYWGGPVVDFDKGMAMVVGELKALKDDK